MLAVEFKHVSKHFGDCWANRDINFQVAPGTIHGIVGENGAGKSTAMKLLYGMQAPSSGEIWVEGNPVHWRSPVDAISAGIGMVHQHFMLAGPCSALDNILLGAEPVRPLGLPFLRWGMPIDRKAARARLDEIAQRYGLPVPWEAPVESLPIGIQQRIEILKLLYRGARILILDEPTAVLTPSETDELLKNLRRLTQEGKTVLIITHKLREILSFTDQVTVFRAGVVQGSLATRDATADSLAELMVGRKVKLSVRPEKPSHPGEEVLKLEKINTPVRETGCALKDLSLTVRAGEIVGVAGVDGNGQSELLRSIFHPAEVADRKSGRVHMFGKDVSSYSAAEIKQLGVGYVPADRHREAMLLDDSIEENFLLGQQRRPVYSKKGLLGFRWIRWSEVKRKVREAVERFDVRPRDPGLLGRALSGGNQQKVVVAREMGESPRLLVVAQPTRGVDIGAIEFIHRQVIEARDRRAGILLVSSELDEVLSLSDRVVVLYGGKIVGEYPRDQVSERQVGLRMGGAQSA